MPTAELVQALGLLAAILLAILAPVVWLGTRSGQAPASAAALALRHRLAAQPAPHRRMQIFRGDVDGFQLEVAVHANYFDRMPPAPLRHDFSRNLAIRLLRREPFGTPFLVENVAGVPREHDPISFGLHRQFKLTTPRPDWLRRLIVEPGTLRLLNSFQEPPSSRPHVLAGFNEHGAVAWMSDPSPDVALQVAEDLLSVMRRLRERYEFMP